MKNNFFAMLSRMKNINRWGLMRNVRQENLSEHSLETAFIAHALAVLRNVRFGGNVDAQKIALIAMYHDTAEIITGDMPTPVKYYNNEIKSTYKEIEKNAEKHLISMLPTDIKPEYESIFSPDDETKAIIKAADKLSALIKCREEKSMGNRDFLSAEQTTEKALKDMNMPEVNAFLQEFMGGYDLTLDQLQK